MKTIGLLGGMSWESSAEYYRVINTEVRRRLGGSASAEIVLYSFDFSRIEALQESDRWEDAADTLRHPDRDEAQLAPEADGQLLDDGVGL